MARFFGVKYVYSEWGRSYDEDDIVYVYLERDCQEFIFQAQKQILKKYQKNQIDQDIFERFEREAENGEIKFFVSENYNQLMIM